MEMMTSSLCSSFHCRVSFRNVNLLVIIVSNYLIYLYYARNVRINALRRVRVNIIAVQKQ